MALQQQRAAAPVALPTAIPLASPFAAAKVADSNVAMKGAEDPSDQVCMASFIPHDILCPFPRRWQCMLTFACTQCSKLL